MKKIFVMFMLSVIVNNVFAGDIVFIDIQSVITEFYKTKLAASQLQQQRDDIKVEVEQMETEIVDMKDTIEGLRKDSRDKTLSDEIRSAKREALEEKLVKLQKKEKEKLEFEQLRNAQLSEQQKRMSLKLMDEVREAVISHAKEKGYEGVIDRSQSPSGRSVVLYSHSSADITSDVIAVLNEEQPEHMEDKSVQPKGES